jgi:hypothetical protein
VRFSAQIRWITATALGLATFGSVMHFPGDFFHENLGAATGWDLSAAAVGTVFGAVTGAIVGFLQWLLLRDVLRSPWSAVLSMAVGFGFTHALGDGVPTSLVSVPVAVASALVLTGALALAYGERRPFPLAASFLGWTGGLLMLHAVRGVLGVDLGGVAVGGLAIGLAWGGLTAAAGFPSRPTCQV